MVHPLKTLTGCTPVDQADELALPSVHHTCGENSLHLQKSWQSSSWQCEQTPTVNGQEAEGQLVLKKADKEENEHSKQHTII